MTSSVIGTEVVGDDSSRNNYPLNDHDYCSSSNTNELKHNTFVSPNSLGDKEPQCKELHKQHPIHTAKRPRQNTSVTDKSQWIMGEEQLDSVLSEHLDLKREKRQRKEVNDPDFSHYTSSESSSSSESEPTSEDCDSEDDPNRLWCVCNRPHGDKFMISCDICKYWYHGHCVGVTESMSNRWEKEKKEWFCAECQMLIQSGTPRHAIPTKIIKKERRKKTQGTKPITGKRGRGRPRKSESTSREVTIRQSARNARKSTGSLDVRVGTRRNPHKPDARSESFEEFENKERLKELIRERKKEFFYKRSLAEQQKAQRMRELGIGRQSITTSSLSDGLDSLATSTSTTNMNNLPINIKSEHKEKVKPNIVLQINTKKDIGDDHNNQRIVTTIVKSRKRKYTESNESNVNDLFIAEPIKINRKSKDTSNSALSTDEGATHLKQRKSIKIDEPKQAAHKKKRKDSESSINNGSSSANSFDSVKIAQKIRENLENRCKQFDDFEVSSHQLERLSTEIEKQLDECFKEGSPKYLNKYRSLIFNLRDSKNQALVKNVLSGAITPHRLVRMSPDEMASSELSKWRERENKHALELIKRDAELAAKQVIVKKTHKGEEVITASTSSEPDDIKKTDDGKDFLLLSSEKDVTSEADTGITPQASESSDLRLSELDGSSSNNFSKNGEFSTSDPFAISSDDHPPILITKESAKKEGDVSSIDPNGISFDGVQSEAPVEQPKRLRISIDTKLDPMNLSLLTEPLVKPIEHLDGECGLSPSKVSPAPDYDHKEEEVEEEEDDVYDPEISAIRESPAETKHVLTTEDEICWSGSITMNDVGKIFAVARPVSEDSSFMSEDVGQNLTIRGRIAPEQITSYIKQIKASAKFQISLIQLLPASDEEKSKFHSFFEHLYTRNRCGVVNTNINSQTLKDFYIMPLHKKSSIPEIFKPVNGPGLVRKELNYLLGVLVIKTSSTPSSSVVYTPTPINKLE